MTFSDLPPGSVMMAGAALLPLLGRRFAGFGAIGLSCLSLLLFLFNGGMSSETVIGGAFAFFEDELRMVRIDKYSRPFLLVFHLAAIIAAIYAVHLKDVKQHAAAMVYAGAAIAAAAAGDLASLFVFWELTAIASVFLIWARGGQTAFEAGMRYLLIQVGSGVLLLSGALVQYAQTGSIEYNSFVGEDGSIGVAGGLVLAALGIKAAFPLLHNWLQDAYPKATPTGTVYLSAFTTKLAIYALLRGFAGFDPLIAVGCVMTLFPILFAVIENDLRRVLAYSLNNQLGFMVVGIGIGTELAINGTIAHAFCHIIYKSLLFMSMGAVLHRVGTCRATELGGLYKSMPWTTVFCIIGAGAISGFPLLSGFVSKSMIITAAAEEHHLWVWIVLLIASAGVMEHSGIKIPFFAFFAHDSGKRVKEAPIGMLVAMAIAAAFCIGLGIAYPLLYQWLPYEAEYHPYTTPHVVNQLQLLMFAALAFWALIRLGLYPEEKRSTNLDSDVVYRKWLPTVFGSITSVVTAVNQGFRKDVLILVEEGIAGFRDSFGPKGPLSRPWSTSTMTIWATAMLAVFLWLYYSN